MSNIQLRPAYWASVSGGKDSLYMLKLILSNPHEYPLDGVVYFDLETDFPFIKDVISYMESECKKYNITFLRIKPRRTWLELYEKYGYPRRAARWCNGAYKLDCKRQLDKMELGRGRYTVYYIGFCADETKRFVQAQLDKGIVRYPLVDKGILESEILHWAAQLPIYNDYYKYNKRCGCIMCPMASRINVAYTKLYYPAEYEKYMAYIKESEKRFGYKYLGRYDSDYLDHITDTKWLPRLKEMINNDKY